MDIKGLFRRYNGGMTAKMRFVYGDAFEKKRAERKRLIMLAPVIAAAVTALGIAFQLTLTEALVLGAGVAFMTVFASERSIIKKAKAKTRLLRLGLADLSERMAVLVDAGIPVWSALVTVSGFMHTGDGALGDELKKAVNDFLTPTGYYYAPEAAMDDLAKRCGDSQVSTFVSLLVQNSKKGAGELASILRLHAVNQREERRAIAKQMADEASTLMVIPSVMVLAAIMILTAAPAVIRFIGS